MARPIIACSARRATRGISPDGRRLQRRRRLGGRGRARRRSRWGPTAPARSESRRASAGSSATSRRSGGCRSSPRRAPTSLPRAAGPMTRTVRDAALLSGRAGRPRRPRPVLAAGPQPSGTSSPSRAASRAGGSPGAPISGTSPSIRRSGQIAESSRARLRRAWRAPGRARTSACLIPSRCWPCSTRSCRRPATRRARPRSTPRWTPASSRSRRQGAQLTAVEVGQRDGGPLGVLGSDVPRHRAVRRAGHARPSRCRPSSVASSGQTAWTAGRVVHLAWTLAYPFNLTGQPAITVPCGFTAMACRSGCRSSGSGTRMAPCCGPPPRSRRPAPGPIVARRCDDAASVVPQSLSPGGRAAGPASGSGGSSQGQGRYVDDLPTGDCLQRRVRAEPAPARAHRQHRPGGGARRPGRAAPSSSATSVGEVAAIPVNRFTPDLKLPDYRALSGERRPLRGRARRRGRRRDARPGRGRRAAGGGEPTRRCRPSPRPTRRWLPTRRCSIRSTATTSATGCLRSGGDVDDRVRAGRPHRPRARGPPPDQRDAAGAARPDRALGRRPGRADGLGHRARRRISFATTWPWRWDCRSTGCA